MKVCEEWFPFDKEKGISSYKGQRSPGFYMCDNLKNTIDLWIKNIKNDWDIVVVISGQGTVRVGKSVLAQHIAAYWTYAFWKKYGTLVPFNIEDNIVFHGSELIRKGNKLGRKHRGGVLIFDEAGADLEGVKSMKKSTQNVKDFFRECGQYNMLNILCLPEFFDLPKSIATNRSNCLIDCYVTVDKDDMWVRGQFNFFSAPAKKKLYKWGKKDGDYKAAKCDFYGDWDDTAVIDQDEYRKRKVEALKTREVVGRVEEARTRYLKGALMILATDFELTHREIARRIGEKTKTSAHHKYIGKLLGGESPEDEED
ncbi:hypothetical protein LCGC14_0708090 [marine sediment metagenome]|uniref:Zona occludens toxin N-terminal domain-containing protein n=1 Tax=marine sediment metagenome TaxID=412755 RepID=A0A0F9QKH7_9ZZZZ